MDIFILFNKSSFAMRVAFYFNRFRGWKPEHCHYVWHFMDLHYIIYHVVHPNIWKTFGGIFMLNDQSLLGWKEIFFSCYHDCWIENKMAAYLDETLRMLTFNADYWYLYASEQVILTVHLYWKYFSRIRSFGKSESCLLIL